MMQFLMGLNDTYNVVRSNILMITPLPNVRQAYSLVIQVEMQRQVTRISLLLLQFIVIPTTQTNQKASTVNIVIERVTQSKIFGL